MEAEEPVRASATCQCVSYCDMFRLTSEQFMVVLEQARTRRGSLMGKDAAGVLKNAVNERNTPVIVCVSDHCCGRRPRNKG